MDFFKRFFKSKTGIEWEERVMFQQTKGQEYFQYAPPVSLIPRLTEADANNGLDWR